MSSVRLANISRCFSQEFYVLQNISFEVKDREVVTILGPSGCHVSEANGCRLNRRRRQTITGGIAIYLLFLRAIPRRRDVPSSGLMIR